MTVLVRRLALMIFAMCAALVGLIPRMLPHTTWQTPDYWQPFGFAACELPCWSGITAGETRFDAAVDLLLLNMPGRVDQILTSGTQINFWSLYHNQAMAGIIQYNAGMVGDVRMTIQLEVGMLIERLGVPMCVWLNDNVTESSGSMVFYWQRDRGSMGALIPNLRPAFALAKDTVTSGFWVSSQPAPCDDSGTIAWRGFATAWRYADWKHTP